MYVVIFSFRRGLFSLCAEIIIRFPVLDSVIVSYFHISLRKNFLFSIHSSTLGIISRQFLVFPFSIHLPVAFITHLFYPETRPVGGSISLTRYKVKHYFLICKFFLNFFLKKYKKSRKLILLIRKAV